MNNAFQQLANRLNDLPNGYPPTESGVELKILEKLFTEEEARLASRLQADLETPQEIANRLQIDMKEISSSLMSMAKKGLIAMGYANGRLAFGIMPFVVGIYELSNPILDAELASLVEEYFQEAFLDVFATAPAFHRVIPIRESVQQDLEILPYESATEILSNAKAWGVTECICRKQKALIGDPCLHPIDVCMIVSGTEGAFDGSKWIRSLSREEAVKTLDRAAAAGLVHSVSNRQEGLWYICNCCTCSCGVLRGLREFGHANVIARSSFVNQVNEEICIACGLCLDACQFEALSLAETAQVDEARCVGCGVCIPTCPEGALSISRRPPEQVKPPPRTEADWGRLRALSRDMN